MPRIMSGAHWFTDIAVGSLALALIGLSWILILPISDKIMKFFDRHLPFKK